MLASLLEPGLWCWVLSSILQTKIKMFNLSIRYILFRDNNCTLQDKEIDEDSELDCSQSQSSQSKLVDEKEALHVTQTKVDNDIQEFDSD